jgi:hypothetical protein
LERKEVNGLQAERQVLHDALRDMK